MSGSYRVVRLQPCHLAAVAQLEAICFPDEPWSESSLQVLCGESGVGFAVLEQDGSLSAYAGMQYAAGEGSVTNVATHPDHRRGGRAAAVVCALLAFAREHCPEGVYLEVRPSNQAALALYARCGFGEVGRRRRFYRFPVEDALILHAPPNTTNHEKE